MPPIRLAELHPIIVHFPIALLLASLALDLAAVIFRRATLVEGATWALLLGAPAAVAALASGWLSEHDVNTGAAPTLLHLHKVCAVLATIVFGTLFILRVVWQSPRWLGWLRSAFPNVGVVVSAQRWTRALLPLVYVKTLPRGVVTAYLILSVIGVVLLALTGYLGGALVYDHGIGLPIH
ncbi:MAG TPA: DUF2231 domain-containing protein [Ktedonobacterales bacterium]|nr:DUF2231 domain-containing protein [Ktedonobacterales bacterium]